MKRVRKSPPRPGHNAISGDGKGRLPYLGHVPAKLTNRTDPSIPGGHTGPKTKAAKKPAKPRFKVIHLTPAESAREREIQRDAQRTGSLTRYLEAKAA